MLQSYKLQKKVVAIWSLFSLLLNIAQPAFVALTLAPVIVPSSVQAEDATNSAVVNPTTTPSPSAEPLVEPIASPIESVAPSPDPTVEPSISPSPSPDIVSPSPSPSLVPSPTPSLEPNTPPVDTPNNPTPPADSSPAPPSDAVTSTEASPSISPAPTPSPTLLPDLNEQLAITIVDHTAAATIEEFDFEVTETGSATLMTDKADYAPTDTAIITGSGFLAGTTYRLTISSADEPATSTTLDLTTDADGTLFYAYQLDGIYRPNYKVEAYLASSLVATTTFTDSNTEIEYGPFEGEIAPKNSNNWTTGNISGYKEGDQIRFRLNLEGPKNSAASGHIFIGFTSDSSCRFFTYANPTEVSVTGTNFSGSFVSLAQNGSDAVADFSISALANNPVYPGVLSFTLTVSDNAAACASGSSQHVQVDHVSGGIKSTGNKALPIPANAVAPVTDLTIAKSGTTSTSIGGNVSYTLTVTNLDFTPASSVVVTDVLPAGITGTTATFDIDPNSVGGTGNCSLVGQTFMCNLGTLAGSDGNTTGAEPDTATITISGMVNNDFSLCATTLTDTASVATTTLESNVNNNSASASTNINSCQGTLRIIKTVVTDNGGNATASDFNLHVKSDGVDVTGSPQAGSATGTLYTLLAGTYTVSEDTPPTGYTQTSVVCDGQNTNSVTVVAGQEKVCTITNDDQQAYVIVDKTVVNDNGGTATPNDFLLTVNGNAVSDGVAYAVNPGTHTAGETLLSGYSAGAWGGDCDANASVTVALGQTKTCTITNNDIAPTLTLVKTVINDDGGNLLVSQVPLFIGSAPATSGTTYDLLANTEYTVSETGQTGYLASLWGGDCASDGTITLLPGDTKTCTITNDDVAPVLTFIKQVTNNYGGTLGASDFPLFINGNSVTSGTPNTLLVNFLYTLTETQQTGYTGGYFTGDCNAAGNISLLPGDNKTCTITNTDVQPKLTITKVVVNDNGGTKVVSDFPLFVDATSVKSGAQNGFNAGTYIVSETGIAGYTAIISGDCDPSTGSVTLAVGDVKACTITNDDQPGTLVVTKVTIPEDTSTLFSITASGTGVIQGLATRNLSDGSPVTYTLDSGIYDVTEAVLAGWSETSNDCIDVVVSNGAESSCTIENTKLGTIIVEKEVSPESDFTFDFKIEGSLIETIGFVLGDGDYNSYDSLPPGTYTVSETEDELYTTIVECVSDQDDTEVASSLNLDPGETITCTYTNTRDTGKITIIKDAVPNDAQDFRFTGNLGEFYLDDDSDSTLSNTIVFDDLETDTYTVTEPNDFPKVWDLESINCTGGSDAKANERNAVIKLAKDEDVACTFTNTRKVGDLTVYKLVQTEVEGSFSSANPGDFTWGLAAENTPYAMGSTQTFDTGDYAVYENDVQGYHLVGWFPGSPEESDYSCENLPDNDDNFSLPANLSITDEEVTQITICNARDTGSLQVYKVADTDGDNQYDTINPADFKWGVVNSQTASTDMGSGQTVVTGNYNVYENIVPSYQFTGWFPGEPIENRYSCTNLPEGEVYTALPTDIAVSQDETTKLTLCNVLLNPELTLEKKNNATGTKNSGDLVTYTLTVALTGSSLSNVIVTDVTPEGFEYVAGSWTSSKSGILEPSYGSPGVWSLGDMDDGDIITLTYQAKIKDGIDGGTYNDIAWAEGDNKSLGTILALGQNSEYVDGVFVGTDVSVGQNMTATGSVAIEGQVLGASTELPATGAQTGWLILALGSLLAGLALLFGSKRIRFTAIFLASSILLLTSMTQKVMAADADNNLSVRLESPISPTRDNDWLLAFSVLDRLSRTPSVACYIKKPGEGSFNQFDTTKVNTKTIGDNNSCHIDGSLMSSQGSYEFYVVMTSGSDSEESTHVTVTYDTEGPDKPVSYSKEHPTSCRYTIKFKTADDNGKTTSVEVFGSKSTSFNTDNSTRIGGVSIGSNQEGSLNHDLIGDDCNQTWYYVIRAFDSVGNQSAHLGDEVVTVSADTPATTPALVVENTTGSILGAEESGEEVSSESGEVLGDDEAQKEETVEGTGLVEGVKDAVKNAPSTKKLWWIFDILAIVVIIYVISRKTKST